MKNFVLLCMAVSGIFMCRAFIYTGEYTEDFSDLTGYGHLGVV